MGEILLAEGQLSISPDLGVLNASEQQSISNRASIWHVTRKPDTGHMESKGRGFSAYGLELLLVLEAEGTALEGNDLGLRVWGVGNGRAALGAEDAVDVLLGATGLGEALGGTFDRDLVLEDDDYESCESREGQRVSTALN